MQLALFDLDNTLLDGDSDYLWGEFMVQAGMVNAEDFKARNEEYFRQYQANTLDIDEYLAFQLDVLTRHPRERLYRWRSAFIEEWIEPRIGATSRKLVARHRRAGHRLAIVTATNRFITEPIAPLFGIDTLIAIELEEENGEFTGRPTGVPSSGEGKVPRIKEFFGADVLERHETWFYSDSIRDLPLLSVVDHPMVVNGDAALLSHAQAHTWPCISTKDHGPD